MKDWQEACVRLDSSLGDVMRQIDTNSLQIALVVDGDGRLAGTITDGDIRRAILKGVSLDGSAVAVMNPAPTTAPADAGRDVVVSLMRSRHLRHIPVVDAEGQLIGLQVLEELLSAPERDNPVVVMAGGLGTRLMPLTANKPKPMLSVGDKPILEHILTSLIEQGYRRFFFAINYLGEMVEAHFGDGARWGVSISYLRERQRMGTAGALSLLPERPTCPFLVMNGDVLTKLNFNSLMEAHEAKRASVTVAVRSYEHQIPFGVARIDDDRLITIEEKPVLRHFVSAGIYVVDPSILDRVDPDRYLDMPELLSGLVGDGDSVRVFPVTEYWLDVGRPDDMQRAIGEYAARQGQSL